MKKREINLSSYEDIRELNFDCGNVIEEIYSLCKKLESLKDRVFYTGTVDDSSLQSEEKKMSLGYIEAASRLFLLRNKIAPVYVMLNRKQTIEGMYRLDQSDIFVDFSEMMDNIKRIPADVRLVAVRKKRKLFKMEKKQKTVDNQFVYMNYLEDAIKAKTFKEFLRERNIKPASFMNFMDYICPDIKDLMSGHTDSHLLGYYDLDKRKNYIHTTDNKPVNLLNDHLKEIEKNAIHHDSCKISLNRNYVGYSIFREYQYKAHKYTCVEVMEAYYKACKYISFFLYLKYLQHWYRKESSEIDIHICDKEAVYLFPNLKLYYLFKDFDDLSEMKIKRLDTQLQFIFSKIDRNIKFEEKDKEIEYDDSQMLKKDDNVTNIPDDFKNTFNGLYEKTKTNLKKTLMQEKTRQEKKEVNSTYSLFKNYLKNEDKFLSQNPGFTAEDYYGSFILAHIVNYFKSIQNEDKYYRQYKDDKNIKKIDKRLFKESCQTVINQLVRLSYIKFGIEQKEKNENTLKQEKFNQYLEMYKYSKIEFLNSKIFYMKTAEWINDMAQQSTFIFDENAHTYMQLYYQYVKDMIITSECLELKDNFKNPFKNIATGDRKLSKYFKKI